MYIRKYVKCLSEVWKYNKNFLSQFPINKSYENLQISHTKNNSYENLQISHMKNNSYENLQISHMKNVYQELCLIAFRGQENIIKNFIPIISLISHTKKSYEINHTKNVYQEQFLRHLAKIFVSTFSQLYKKIYNRNYLRSKLAK